MQTSEFWLPEKTPPLLDRAVAEQLTKKIRQDSVMAIAAEAEKEFDNSQPRIRAYLDELGFELNAIANDGPWPAKVLAIAAALAYLGYERSRQITNVDRTFDLSRVLADIQGVPAAFIISASGDPVLSDVFTVAFTDPRLREVNGDGYLQVAGIGAGCVRFYLQEAMLAA